MGAACSRRGPAPASSPVPAVEAALLRGPGACGTGSGAKGAAPKAGGASGGGSGSGAKGTAPKVGGTSGSAGTWRIASASAQGGAELKRLDEDRHASLHDFAAELREEERHRRESVHAAAEALRAICGPQVRLVKSASIDGRLLFVIDGAVPEDVHHDLFECLEGDAFRRTEFARPDTREFRHHIVEYSPEKLKRTELGMIVRRLVQLLFPTSLEVYRIYTNAVMYGDAAFAHRDSSDDDHVTALVYPNPEWAAELGGETVFYSEDREIAEAVEPRPGRICLFHGNILHKGSPPSRLFWGSRYTTAFKFAPSEAMPLPPGQGQASASSGSGHAGETAGLRGDRA